MPTSSNYRLPQKAACSGFWPASPNAPACARLRAARIHLCGLGFWGLAPRIPQDFGCGIPRDLPRGASVSQACQSTELKQSPRTPAGLPTVPVSNTAVLAPSSQAGLKHNTQTLVPTQAPAQDADSKNPQCKKPMAVHPGPTQTIPVSLHSARGLQETRPLTLGFRKCP